MDEDNCLIEKVESCDTPLSPILINFEHGHHPENDNAELHCDMFVDEEDNSKRELVVTRRGQRFVGKLAPEETPMFKSLLLIRNKRTNKARAVLMQSCNLINQIQEEESNREKSRPSKALITQEEKLSAINILRKSYGSKKSKRASEMGLRINMNVSGKEEEMKETVSSIDVKLSEITNDNDGREELLKLIPPCNRNATSVNDIYDINSIVSESERETLKSQAEFLINNGLTDKDEKSSFFMFSYYTALGDNPDIDKVVLLIYANTLYKFYKLGASDLKKKNLHTLIHPTSRPVALRVLKDFTVLTKGGRTRPSLYKDKLVCYIMVLILLLADFKINFDTLSSCLVGFGTKKLLQLARVVGVIPTSSFSSAKVFTLKVPLPPLPKPRMPRKRATVSF